MNVVPERLPGGRFLKKALVFVVVLVLLIVGSAILVDLGSTDTVTVTFEGVESDRARFGEHISGYDYDHQTSDARSGRTVITNSRDGVSEPSRPLKILFHGPRVLFAFHAMAATKNRAEIRAYGLDRNQERVTSPYWRSADGVEWVRMSPSGGTPIHGIEVWAKTDTGRQVPVYVDDLEFEGSPAISRATLLAGLATLWTAGLAILFVVTGLFERLRAIFDGGRRK